MPFQPEIITREYLFNTLSGMNKGDYILRGSTKWALVYKDKTYSPKDTGRATHELTVG